jgi:hypothetical protein
VRERETLIADQTQLQSSLLQDRLASADQLLSFEEGEAEALALRVGELLEPGGFYYAFNNSQHDMYAWKRAYLPIPSSHAYFNLLFTFAPSFRMVCLRMYASRRF